MLSNVTSTDAGIYYCEAVDNEGIYSERKEVMLIVKCKFFPNIVRNLIYCVLCLALLP